MKRVIRKSVGAIIVLVAIAFAFYTQRVRIADLVAESSAPELPAAVGYAEAVAGEEKVMGVEGVKVVEEVDGTDATPTSVVAPTPAPAQTQPPSVPLKPSTTSIPSSFNLAVPFTSQAPFSNWDETHQETCEEAAVYMAAEFFKGATGVIDPAVAETELQRLVAMENDLFGYFEDTTADETMLLVSKAYPNLHVQTMNDLTVENIKAEIAAGHPVIVPTAGRMLRNPNFTGEGPLYHMIVIRGYTETQFITNDPGTRRGNGYVYDIDTVMTAMHDWNGGDVGNGKKVVIVMYPL